MNLLSQSFYVTQNQKIVTRKVKKLSYGEIISIEDQKILKQKLIDLRSKNINKKRAA
jgi:ribosome-associated protein YbcJ (S4-like RNA binding protein)